MYAYLSTSISELSDAVPKLSYVTINSKVTAICKPEQHVVDVGGFTAGRKCGFCSPYEVQH